MREYHLQIYKNNFNKVKSISTIYLSQDKNINLEIRFIIIIKDGNSFKDKRIKKINLNNNLNYLNKSKNYLIS